MRFQIVLLISIACGAEPRWRKKHCCRPPPPAPRPARPRSGISWAFHKGSIRFATLRRIAPATIRPRSKPPLLSIADPKNMQSDVPAIKKAAKVKAAEDQAPQKMKALKYLARVGCGCYDKDGEVTAAFLALDDCTEEVRFQAAINIMDAAKNHCKACETNVAARKR